MYGAFPDVHKRTCIREVCERCLHYDDMRYMPDFWKDIFRDNYPLDVYDTDSETESAMWDQEDFFDGSIEEHMDGV